MRAHADGSATVKVAIAANGADVSPHFGHCEHYVLADVNGGQVTNREQIASPGHEPGRLPRFLHELGAGVIIAGGIGGRAQELFLGMGIECVAGVEGPVSDVLAAYAAGQLRPGQSLCHHVDEEGATERNDERGCR